MVAALDLVWGVAPRRYAHGEAILRQGEAATALSLVTSGVVRLSAVTSSGREVVLALLGPGKIFGESSLLDGEPSPVEARAVGSATVIELPASHLQAVLRRNPAVAEQLVRFVAERLHRTSATLRDAMAHDLTARLSHRLRELASDHGRERADGVHLRLALTQEELARMVGASREAVNRTLAALSARGVIRTQHRRLVIRDLDALERAGSADRTRRLSRIPGGG